jgi:hypothetical protein
MDLYMMCRWFEHYDGHEFQRNNWTLLKMLDSEGKLIPVARDAVQDRAWTAYYTTMRDDPEATPEHRERAEAMLARFGPGGLLDKVKFDKPKPTFKPMQIPPPAPAVVDVNDLV